MQSSDGYTETTDNKNTVHLHLRSLQSRLMVKKKRERKVSCTREGERQTQKLSQSVTQSSFMSSSSRHLCPQSLHPILASLSPLFLPSILMPVSSYGATTDRPLAVGSLTRESKENTSQARVYCKKKRRKSRQQFFFVLLLFFLLLLLLLLSFHPRHVE